MKKLTIKEAKKIAPEYVKEIEKTKTKIDYFFTVIDEDKYNTQLYVKVK